MSGTGRAATPALCETGRGLRSCVSLLRSRLTVLTASKGAISRSCSRYCCAAHTNPLRGRHPFEPVPHLKRFGDSRRRRLLGLLLIIDTLQGMAVLTLLNQSMIQTKPLRTPSLYSLALTIPRVMVAFLAVVPLLTGNAWLLHFRYGQRNTRSHTISLLLLLVCSFRILLARASAFYQRPKVSLFKTDTQYYFIRRFAMWCVWVPRVNWGLGSAPLVSRGESLRGLRSAKNDNT